MIWTFYSAERRVGRSMALANVAELCRRAGDRVVLVDWDLEAPGLDRLFPAAARDIEQRPGLIDLTTARIGWSRRLPGSARLGSSNALLPVVDAEQFLFCRHRRVLGPASGHRQTR